MPTVRPRTTIYLWEFLLQLLDGEESCAAISWVNRERGEFVLKDQSEIAKLWGKVKGRPAMDKIKLGRAMRYYYKKKLLAKVPRRKAVYRFTKFDYLKQKESEIIRRDDFPEIDFSGTDNAILDLISDDRSEGECSVEPEMDGDEDDTPLERLLAEKQQQVFQEEKSQTLLPVEAHCNSYNSLENLDTSGNSFYDYNSNYEQQLPSACEDYYVPSSEMNTFSTYENYSVKTSNFQPVDYSNTQYYHPAANCATSYSPCDNDSGHLASLLLNSILMSDQQTLQDSSGIRENYNTAAMSCASGNNTPEPILSPTLAHMKTEANVVTSQEQFHQNIDIWSTSTFTESTLNNLKEFERLLMLNRRP